MSEKSKSEIALDNVVEKVGAVVADAAELKVQTWFLVVDEGKDAPSGAGAKQDFETKKRPLARTIVKIDGDSESIVPMRWTEEGGVQVDEELSKMHNENVEIARKYRADVINMFLGLVT